MSIPHITPSDGTRIHYEKPRHSYLIARKGSLLLPEGPSREAQHMSNCTDVEFEDNAHMVFLDEPDVNPSRRFPSDAASDRPA
ncbi:hypothetical protein [Gluconobacter kanchanaburiensis]|uniref:Uncharacterized protein n=1 Tax=Gluconobacter kanchanaburiensis NBRC 103587 TaxID=1307948 RepID=A0A511B9M6_9PROT|nr:hypothetical protein [Gluconobacter kanchanaburiensis]MBF0862855.1 hypothetical protein [Gluconobacter kanchanaburiensis]GBR70496.1 hypothetical protein AA103587_1900 [Gluconobacter kanchanaburiensis NBRC 103587]GEK97140.1 hypothetical protein GKA01_23370 [Gluconobacter kanchanaburiensis NBRC 103587]